MKLTVIIPVYNQELLIKRAVASIPHQCEIIIVNDGSTDDTAKSIIELNSSDLNITVCTLHPNQGVSVALNKGLDAATGDYIVLLGSDDYFYTSELERLMAEMDGTDLIYFNLRDNSGNVWNVTPDTKQAICGSVKLMRRDFVGSTRNQEDRRAAEDLYFYQELLAKNPTEKFTNIVAKHYNHPREGSLSDLYAKGEL